MVLRVHLNKSNRLLDKKGWKSEGFICPELLSLRQIQHITLCNFKKCAAQVFAPPDQARMPLTYKL